MSQPIPSVLLHSILVKLRPLRTARVELKGKNLLVNAFHVDPSLLAKVPRMGPLAAMYLGEFPDRKQMVKLYAKSVPLAQLERILDGYPFVVTVSQQRGTKSDTLEPDYKLITSRAFRNLTDWPTAKLRTLKQWRDHRPVKDFQRKRLYEWETRFLTALGRADAGWARAPEDRLKAIADEIIARYGIPADRVFVNTSHNQSARHLGVCKTYRDDVVTQTPNFVLVNIHDSTPDTLIHELAHAIVNFRYGRMDKIAGHGGEFCGTYAHLLGEYTPYRESAVLAHMERVGRLKVTPFEP